MKHETPAVGMFFVSDDPECWPASPAFDTREECLAHAKAELDFPVWVGRISFALTDAAVAGLLLRSDESVEEDVSDEYGFAADDPLIDISREVRVQMEAAIEEILRRNNCVTHWYQVADVQRIEEEEDHRP